MKYFLLILILSLTNAVHSQWISLNSGTTATLRTVFFINSNTGYSGGDNGIVIKTTNVGQTWNDLSSGTSENINSIYFLNSNSGIACGNAGVIIITTNSGTNWNTVTSGVTDDLRGLSFFNAKGICTGSSGTHLYTTNSGLDWAVAKNGFLTTFHGADMVSESVAYSCGVNSIFQPFVGKSANGGANWTYTNFYLNGNEGGFYDVNFINENVGFTCAYVFDGQGAISYTSNGGEDWSTQLFPNQLYGLDVIGINTAYSVGNNGAIVKTTNKGITWTTQSVPTAALLRSVSFVDSASGYAAGDNGTILKTTNGGMSSVTGSTGFVPEGFILYQNYPNPFNPATKIKYSVSEKEFLSLTVYDATGKVSDLLISGMHTAGNYEVNFDGSDFPAGVYFYTLNSEGYSLSQKFVLLK